MIDLMIDPAANSVPQVRAGTIKAYAVTSRHRTPAAPDVPTVDEAGLRALRSRPGTGMVPNAEGHHCQAQWAVVKRSRSTVRRRPR